MNKMSVIVFGGDGFCGWPTSLYLSRCGYDVIIVDNFSRREIDVELGSNSLTPIQSIQKRTETWKNLTGNYIYHKFIDLSECYCHILDLLRIIRPQVVIHFAEQRAAPYSMKSPYHKCYTVNNNTNATHNILCAIAESGLDIHLVHLGSTGVYGYSSADMTIPEGYMRIKVNVDGEDKEMEIPYPPQAGSIYHMTKTMDSMMFNYYNKNDELRITDLHQGIVWGTQTEETKLDENLINRFDYDGDYGTVLNRFIMQAAVGHPLTVHGTGGQTRAFIHIKDTVQCVKMAIENPPIKGEKVQILNQTTEQLNVKELAFKIQDLTGAEIRYYNNPRNEANSNELSMSCEGLLRLGLNPTTLSNGGLLDVYNTACAYKDRCDLTKIPCTSTWRSDIHCDIDGQPSKKEVING